MAAFLLAAAFALTALLYASVGFGGGSTYTALLALAGADYRLIPIVSLACNIVVVAGGTVRFARSGQVPWRGALVLTAIAAPAAFLGGLTPIARTPFIALLGASLIAAGAGLLMRVGDAGTERPHALARFAPLAAAPLGYLAGIVGLGGGIFLAPLLHLVRWNTARAIAATASLFILVNSLFGLAGQLAKAGGDTFSEAVAMGWTLIFAVLVGGQAGSLLAARILPLSVIRTLTAALTLFVGMRVLLAM